LYEPGKTSHELANNGSWVSIISIVTRLEFVIPSRLGSIRSNGNTIKIGYEALYPYNSMGKI
jgi:hypothetical protein